MSTVTAHTLFSRAAIIHSAGGSSLRRPKPAALVSLPYAPNSGKKTPRSVCHYANHKSVDHPSNIPPFALVHPVMPTKDTENPEWRIKDYDTKVELRFLNLPEKANPSDFHVDIEGNVLVVRAKWEQPGENISFQVRLYIPKLYNRNGITARLQQQSRHLVVVIPKEAAAVFCKKINMVIETND